MGYCLPPVAFRAYKYKGGSPIACTRLVMPNILVERIDRYALASRPYVYSLISML